MKEGSFFSRLLRLHTAVRYAVFPQVVNDDERRFLEGLANSMGDPREQELTRRYARGEIEYGPFIGEIQALYDEIYGPRLPRDIMLSNLTNLMLQRLQARKITSEEASQFINRLNHDPDGIINDLFTQDTNAPSW